MNFQPVAEQHLRIAIVADGPSAAPLRTTPLPRSVYVIAVNGAIDWLPRADAFFTLDHSPANRQRLREQRHGIKYFSAVPPEYGQPNAAVSEFRAPPEPNVHWLMRIAGERTPDNRWSCVFGPLAVERDRIHTGNGAFGALGLAAHMRPTLVVLFGVDGSQDERVSGGAPRNSLAHLPRLFDSCLPLPFDVLNASVRSAVTCFPRIKLTQALERL